MLALRDRLDKVTYRHSGATSDRRKGQRGAWAAALYIAFMSGLTGAQAQDRPSTLPARDVVVDYRVDGTGLQGAHKLHVVYADGGRRVRIDYYRWVEAKVPFMALVYDRPADRIIAVMFERHSFVERPIATSRNPADFLQPDWRFQRQGMMKIADTDCTEWKLRPADKQQDLGAACVTADGLVLRLSAVQPAGPSLTAIAVTYGPPPDGAFDPPTGLTRVTPLR